MTVFAIIVACISVGSMLFMAAVTLAQAALRRVDAFYCEVKTMPPDEAIAAWDSKPLVVRLFERIS